MNICASKIPIFLPLLSVTVLCSNLRSDLDVTSSSTQSSGDILQFVFGPILFIMSFVLIWYNEKRAALNTRRFKTVQNLLENQPQILTIVNNSMSEELVPVKEKQTNGLVYLSGELEIIQGANDFILNQFSPKSVKIQRKVQVKQYRNIKQVNDTLLGWYSYNTQVVQGQNKNNPESNWFIRPQKYFSKNTKLQGYTLSESEIEQIQTNRTIQPNQNIASSIAKKFNKDQWVIEGEYIYFPAISQNIQSHGTLRVKYLYAEIQNISIISSYSLKNGRSLTPFRIDLHENNGKQDKLCCENQAACCMCNALGQLMKPIKQIDIVLQGEHTQQQMVNRVLQINTCQSWFIRVLCYVFMIMGIYLFFTPIANIIGAVPLIGWSIKTAAEALVFTGALIVCFPLFLITFSLAWLVYHPKTGVLFLIAGIISIGLVILIKETTTSPSAST